MATTRGRARPGAMTWRQAAPAPVVLVTGPEELLAERAADRVVATVRRDDPQAEVVRLDAAEYPPGALAVATSPSLFAEAKVVVLTGLERGDDRALADATAYLGAPAPDAVVVLRLAGQEKLAEKLAASDLPVVGEFSGGPEKPVVL